MSDKGNKSLFVGSVKSSQRKVNQSQMTPSKAGKTGSRYMEEKIIKMSGKSPSHGKVKNRPKENAKQLTSVYKGVDLAYLTALLAPDLTGPIRIPSPGAFDRTVLGMDRTRFAITQANPIDGFLLINNYIDSMRFFTAPGGGSLLVAGVALIPGSQFPVPGQVNDARLVGCTVVVEYIGPLLDAGGLLLFGTIPDQGGSLAVFGATNFDTLALLPETVQIPVNEIIDKPMRVSMTHDSPAAWEFYPTNGAVVDVRVPFVLAVGMPNSATLQCTVTRTWEVRSSVAAASSIPFDAGAGGRAKEEAKFTDVGDFVSKLGNTVTEALADFALPALKTGLQMLPSLLSGLGSKPLEQLPKMHMARLEGAQPLLNHSIDPLPRGAKYAAKVPQEACGPQNSGKTTATPSPYPSVVGGYR